MLKFCTNPTVGILYRNLQTSTLVLHFKPDKSKVPILREEDLEENSILGSGPGGQSINKTKSVCHLKHIPTGLIVRAAEERSLHKNRKIAREMMITKLDDLINKENSVSAQKKRYLDMKSNKSSLKAEKKRQKKAEWKKSLAQEDT